MNAKDLVAASQLAKRFGVKSVLYGGPGAGKTPLITTAPRPILCVVEPGMLSMRHAHNIPAFEAFTVNKIDEFFTWFLQSNEARNFDTLAVDSVSQFAEIVLAEELKRNKDGRRAYGLMAQKVMETINALYYLPAKHIVLIAKQGIFDESGISTKKPYFPGQELNVKIPHLYDEILHLDFYQVPGVPQPVKALRCHPMFGISARDRSGNLLEFEQPDLAALFAKCML